MPLASEKVRERYAGKGGKKGGIGRDETPPLPHEEGTSRIAASRGENDERVVDAEKPAHARQRRSSETLRGQERDLCLPVCVCGWARACLCVYQNLLEIFDRFRSSVKVPIVRNETK